MCLCWQEAGAVGSRDRKHHSSPCSALNARNPLKLRNPQDYAESLDALGKAIETLEKEARGAQDRTSSLVFLVLPQTPNMPRARRLGMTCKGRPPLQAGRTSPSPEPLRFRAP